MKKRFIIRISLSVYRQHGSIIKVNKLILLLVFIPPGLPQKSRHPWVWHLVHFLAIIAIDEESSTQYVPIHENQNPALWYLPLQIIKYLYTLHYKCWVSLPQCNGFTTSVADTDPVGSGCFESPGSGSWKIPDPDPLLKKTQHCCWL